MKKLDELAKKEETVGKTMADYQQYLKELSGIDPRAGQIGPSEIYKIAYKAAMDAINDNKSKLIVP